MSFKSKFKNGGKNIRRIAIGILAFFTLLLMGINVSAETIIDVLDEPIEYLDDDWSNGLLGDVNLVFNNSDKGNDDIIFLNRFFIPGPNQTYYKMKSKNITYDFTFINDTKSYFYRDSNNWGSDKNGQHAETLAGSRTESRSSGGRRHGTARTDYGTLSGRGTHGGSTV